MSATKLYTAGYRPLVCVVPPGAIISPNSSISPKALGKVPGKKGTKGWYGYGFTTEIPPTKGDLKLWESWGANTGILARSFPGLDIDVEDAQLARFVMQEAHAALGPSPIRTSREPRKLLVYRTDEPFTRIAATINYRGKDHVVEMLGEGLQYIVHGKHPSGTDYGWQGKPLWDYKPEDLRPVTAGLVLAFMERLKVRLDGRATVEISGTGKLKKKTDAPPQDDLKAPSLEALESVVSRIPNEYPSRDEYVLFGHAVKAAGGDAAEHVFQEWASRWTDGANDPDTVSRDWSRMQPPYRVGWTWLQEQAAATGEYLSAVDEFNVDSSAVGPKAVEIPDVSDGVISFTDTWVVERIARWLKDQIRFVPGTGNFHVWGG